MENKAHFVPLIRPRKVQYFPYSALSFDPPTQSTDVHITLVVSKNIHRNSPLTTE